MPPFSINSHRYAVKWLCAIVFFCSIQQGNRMTQTHLANIVATAIARRTIFILVHQKFGAKQELPEPHAG
jgi:hypothetical protein